MSEYRLRRRVDQPVEPPVLDPAQSAVIEHMARRGGPLQVLAGPGAGKTTTVVELVVDRVTRSGLDPQHILVLTFSRKAAQELRSRIARRLQRTTATTPAMTFHSFCYSLLRAEQDPDAFADPLRLLSAPEQDAVLAEVLRGQDPSVWPPALRPALGTHGFASELQRLLSAARSQGMDALDLVGLGRAVGRDDWAAAGEFFDELTSVAALANTIDHTDMVFQAVRLLGERAVRHRWRDRFALVVVDEYQDTDPLQVELLQALAGDGRDLVVVGDPYQSIYGFRGADVRGIVDFPEQFCTREGQPAPRITLNRTNRYGQRIAQAVGSILDNRSALAAVDTEAFAQLRHPSAPKDDPGTVMVRTFASTTAESEAIALLLREQHLHHGRAWSDMAVLVRSTPHLVRIRRALQNAGVPVAAAGDELPLAAEPAVRALLAALHAADAIWRGEPLGPDQAQALLTGPIGGLDAGGLRRLGRVLRRHDPDEYPRPSRVLLAEALTDPTWLATLHHRGIETSSVRAAADLAALLRRAAEQIGEGVSAEQVLWTLWDGTSWPRRLRDLAESATDGSAQAHHDLDALCALFAEAARTEERQARRSVREVVHALEAQQIPADTLAQEADLGSAVQIMTTHRSKGLEWPLVVVAGVQDGEWPDVRLRSSLLQPDRLGAHRIVTAPTLRTALAEERRLFYVACTRASSMLVVTAVESAADDGDQPSRFVTELRDHLGQPVDPEPRPRRALSLRSAAARLRALGESTDDPVVLDRAAALLARIAAHPAGRPAHPERWWGLADRTTNQVPVRDPQQPLALSGSQVKGLVDCPLQWFLGHEAKGSRPTSAAQGFGSIVHAIAADVVRQGIADPDPEALALHLDEVWGQLDLPAWIARREKEQARQALVRFASWHRDNPRTVIDAEREFVVEFPVDGRLVQIRGSMDRVEIDADGGVHVVDFKTGTSKPTAQQLAQHPQLGVYQLVVEHGALPDHPQAPAAGAELVHLRQDASTKLPDHPKVQAQDRPHPDQPFFALDQIRAAVGTIDTEQFVATPDENGPCRHCDFVAVCPAQAKGASILDLRVGDVGAAQGSGS